MKNILIIGATGSIGQATRERFLTTTDDRLTLFARHTAGLKIDPQRERIISGDAGDPQQLAAALEGQDVGFAALSGDLPKFARALIQAMTAASVQRLIFISSMGIYNEIPSSVGASGNLAHNPMLRPYRQAADLIEASSLAYTIIRPGWFDNGSTDYQVTHKGEPFGGHDVARTAIAAVIVAAADQDLYLRESIGLNRPE
ncbi:NAD(P)H-binding protein [Lapidilactobacillus achengensis]|uniref:NAD(P)H-binding protein n=1 Tax=Lapidilactobacillus achengensis TaxID=2486000 RepID=A0ABW1UJ77_9LACO|nr:NAD(P)H-binding protein [Lapidilactobacillus achengensis]